LFLPLKQQLGGNEEVEMVVCEWLGMQEPEFYNDGILEPVLK
jgi:hypothetical protein